MMQIQCTDVHKSFSTSLFSRNRFHALKNISFEINKGGTYALVGPNGSGKTTLLSCILGLYNPTQGSIRIDGLDPQDPLSKKNIGYLPEHFTTYANVTPVQAIAYYATLSSIAIDTNTIYRWLDRLELDKHKHRNIGSFSKGMIQRLGIVISLIHNPQIVIWDEPSSGLDPEGRKLVLDLIQEEKSQGKTFIISTHILSDIEKTCDHMLILKNGNLLLNQDIQSACSAFQCKDVESLYLQTIHKDTQ